MNSEPATPAQERLFSLWAEYSDLSTASGLLSWDQETVMPEKGQRRRGEVLATLAALAHRKLVSGEMLEAVEAAEAEAEAGSVAAAHAREARNEVDRARRVPEALETAFARSRSDALVAWQEARREKDFTSFQPHLERQVVLVRERAEAIADGGPAYDALLQEFEPGATAAELEPLFDELHAELAPLVRAVADSGVRPDETVAQGNFPVEAQRAFVEKMAAGIGFDFRAGRLDPAAHPFCSGAGNGDVRLTWRWDEKDFRPALFGVIHEAGHGLYEQGLPSQWSRTPLGRDAGLGIHESQSRLWENRVGRSRAFWNWAMPAFREAFPGHAPDSEELWRALHTCKPSPIRVEADEATYDLHVLLRFGIERALIGGEVEVTELPELWRTRSEELLGLTPANDAEGVLQDIHWAMGLFGYFPTYTLGNLYSAQLYSAADRDLGGLEALHAKGEFGSLLEWLRERVHSHGRHLRAAELVERATGEAPNPRYLLDHLQGTVGEVYGTRAPLQR